MPLPEWYGANLASNVPPTLTVILGATTGSPAVVTVTGSVNVAVMSIESSMA